jgi:threonine aldolase
MVYAFDNDHRDAYMGVWSMLSITTSRDIGGAIYRMHKGWAVLSITTSANIYLHIEGSSITPVRLFFIIL